MNNAGLLAYRQEDLETAAALFEEEIAVLRAAAADLQMALPMIGIALGDLGDIAAVRGEVGEAMARYEEALALHRATGYGWGLSPAAVGLGALALLAGDADRAAARFAEGLAAGWAHADAMLTASALVGAAALAAHRGQFVPAARLLGASEGMANAAGTALFPLDRGVRERCLALLGRGMAETALAEHRAAGAALSRAAAVAEAELVLATGGEPAAEHRPRADDLTPREREVLTLIVAGKTDREIAATLFVSRRTVTTHTSNLFVKLGVSGRAEAAARAVRDNLV